MSTRVSSLTALAVAGALGLALARGDSSTTATFSVDARQARQVRAVVELVRAVNGRKLAPALAVLAPAPGGSDCDYRREQAFEFRGRAATIRWLRARFADHDRLTLARISNENPTSSRVGEVQFARRTNDTLRARGFAGGIVPKSSAKVVFTSGDRVLSFAFGPIGGSQDLCRPG